MFHICKDRNYICLATVRTNNLSVLIIHLQYSRHYKRSQFYAYRAHVHNNKHMMREYHWLDKRTESRTIDINVRMKRTRNCVKQLVANVRHSSSLPS